jgi:hypothetical protein
MSRFCGRVEEQPGNANVRPSARWLVAAGFCLCWAGRASAEVADTGAVPTSPSPPSEPVPTAAPPDTLAPAASEAAPPSASPTADTAAAPRPPSASPAEQSAAVNGDDADLSPPTGTAPPAAGPAPTAGGAPSYSPVFYASPHPVRDRGASPDGQAPRSWAALADVGFPDGLMVGAGYRPVRWLRLQGSAGTNAIGLGVRASVVLAPLGTGPFLALQAGHYFEGNANGAASVLGGPNYERTRTAREVGYQFASLHGGLEFGGERLAFFVRGGISYLRATLHHVDDVIEQEASGDMEGPTTVSFDRDPRVTAWVPALGLGFMFYLV